MMISVGTLIDVYEEKFGNTGSNALGQGATSKAAADLVAIWANSLR